MIRRSTQGLVAAAGLAGAALFASAGAVAGDTVTRTLDDGRVLVVDYSGRPPYRRTIVDAESAPVADFARFEEVTDAPAPRVRGPRTKPRFVIRALTEDAARRD